METPVFNDRENAVLDALLATIAPPECDRPTAREALRTALARLAPHRLTKLRSLLGLLSGPVLSAALIGRFASFPTLDQAAREKLLRALADSRLAPLRTGFQAFKRLCGFVAYASTNADGENPLWPIVGYPGPRADRPRADAATPLVSRLVAAEHEEFDVVVVGSGAGGGVAAGVLAKAGKRVLVLEAGPPADSQSFTQREADAFRDLYLDSALTSSEDLGVAILAGACVGGGTTVNWCTSLRLAEQTARQWSDASGGIDFLTDLAPHYQAVGDRIAVQTSPTHNPNNAALLRGCTRLGWHAAGIPRDAANCGDGCGYCGFGCAYGNKTSTAQTFLCDAVAAGARVIANARVDRVVIPNGRAAGVEGALPERSFRVAAKTVILAAGSLRTPAILARSGIRSAQNGRHLRLHPTTAIFAGFDEPVETWLGPMQTVVSEQFRDIADGYGATFEAVPAHPGLSALALPWRSQEQHAALMRRARYAAAWIVLTRDRGEGSVSTDGRADIDYEVDAFDGANMTNALAGLVEIAFAAGASDVVTLHADPMRMTREQATRATLDRFAQEIRARGTRPNRLGIFSAHQMGTCRMHRDARHGVVDWGGNVHGAQGLLVADASVFPLSSGVNPMLTIMALAHRIASRLV